MKHIVLTWWKPDADEHAIEQFLEEAPRILARGPFLSCIHGVGKKPGGQGADWAFVAELPDGPDDVWAPSEAHQELHKLIAPIIGEFRSIDI